ncbi:MAG: hypothetical protein K2X48_18825 [Chitinophagaceae bacterium]|nr:hypothetical protein [Chitinophagaceae bacterium]
MKKVLFLLLLFFCNAVRSQPNQINIVNFTVKNTLPAKIDDWLTVPGALLLSAQKSPQARDLKAALMIQIRSGGAVICGTNAAGARPLDPFDVRAFNTSELLGLLNNCKELKEGAYTICAQFFSTDRKELSREVCKDFKVEGAQTTEYAPPALITPDNEKKLSTQQLQGPVTFRWTPLVPKPQQPVTYRLKVWQLMQGQNGTDAMRTNPPIVTKDVDNITQAVVSGIYTGPCRPPYLCDYVWNVQALTRDGKPIGNNNGTSEPFRFKADDDQTASPPKNIFPADKKQFTEKEMGAPVTFRWTPPVPKPQEPVTYRLKVWQLMQGQNGATAMRTNKPIVTKDVADITEATVSGIYTGPCRPPYLCDYVWTVQALNKAGNPIGNNNGNSEPTVFSMVASGANAEFKIDSAVCLPKENGLFRYHIWGHYKNMASSSNNILLNDALSFPGYPSNPNPGPGTNLRNNIRMKSGTYNGALTMNDILEASSGTISNITPLPASILTPASLAPNSTHNFQFDYSTSTNSPVQFTYYGLVDDALKFNANRNSRNEIDSLKYPRCPCSACDEVTINVNQQGNITNTGNGGLNFTVSVSSSPKKVKRIRAELVYFDMKPEDENCLTCNKNDTYFGNFINASTTNNNFTGVIQYPHSAQFDAPGDVNISGGVPLSFTVSIPPMVSCCNADVNFCIRYVLTYEDCTVCNKLVCYNYKITGCQKK